MGNMTRWRDTASLQKDWAERARFVARFVPPGSRVLDLGCGAMDLERFAAAADYLPVDVVARDARTRVVDLNVAPIPTDLLRRADIVTLLGVVEYLDDVPGLFRQVAAAGRPVLFTYCVSERHVGIDRLANDWVNDFSTADLLAMLETAGLEPAQSFVFNGAQRVVLARPRGTSSEAPSPSRPSLVVAGHYGRGNCGDEALLQCIFEAFRDSYDIIVSVDERGAFPGFWDWYPYTASRVIHRTNDAIFYRNPPLAGLIVGGGGLPLGYAANQVVAARLSGKRAVIAGVDQWETTDERWVTPYASLFDLVAFRTAEACRAAGDLVGAQHLHGGDWALLLPTDAGDDVTVDRRRALVTVREFSLNQVPRAYVAGIEALLANVRAQGFAPAFLPFCPEDERFLADLGLDGAAPVERHWWNPRRMKQVIAASGMMLSVGRLHPLVFAASAGVPVASVVPALAIAGTEGALPKLRAMTAELDIAVLTRPDEIEAFLRAPRPADAAKVAAATERARLMIERLRTIFAAPAEA